MKRILLLLGLFVIILNTSFSRIQAQKPIKNQLYLSGLYPETT